MEEINDILLELQELLASVDLKQVKKSRSFKIEVASKLNMKFRMEPDQHQRPHVHIQYGKENHKASYAINNGELLAGNLPPYHEKVVIKWISDKSKILDRLWTTLKQGKNYSSIIKEFQGDDK